MERDFNKGERADDNVIFIGSKPLVNYIKSILMQFNKKDVLEVIIRSRGKFISKAVDAVEVVKRIVEDRQIKVKSINISSESFEKEGRKTNVSTMDIVLGI